MKQPRDSKGNFKEIEIVNSEDEMVEFYISEYECRVIGNRLSRVSDRCEKVSSDYNIHLNQDLEYWASRFLNACSTRDEKDDKYYEKGEKRHIDSNYHIKIQLTDYECWSLGNRLFEMGQELDKKDMPRVADETKWLARRFHAER
jgi:hypothetical protein